jgi:hypothetical protein
MPTPDLTDDELAALGPGETWRRRPRYDGP